MRQKWCVLLLCLFLMSSGCALFRKVVVPYKEAKLPSAQIVRDLAYTHSVATDSDKNKLDLFLPSGKNWPVMVFVHGGAWVTGDRALKVLGSDIYGNIGRYFAAQGIGVAVISYHLMPQVSWKAQIRDVARGIDWVHDHIRHYGGDPKRLFLMGHSSGAQLVARVALDSNPLAELHDVTQAICGVIAVSGAGYDLTDQETYELAQKEGTFEKLFNTGSIPNQLRRQLSPIKYVNGHAPAFLVMYSEKEENELKAGSFKFHQRLVSAGVKSLILEIPNENHATAVLALSNPETRATAAAMTFVQSLSCGQTSR